MVEVLKQLLDLEKKERGEDEGLRILSMLYPELMEYLDGELGEGGVRQIFDGVRCDVEGFLTYLRQGFGRFKIGLLLKYNHDCDKRGF